MREGRTVYYAYINGRDDQHYREGSVSELTDLLEGRQPKIHRQPVARCARRRVLHTYEVTITVKYPACDDPGTKLEIDAYSAKEAIKSARKKAFMYYSRFDGAKTYSAKRID
jgi:hypothetical protein